MQDAVYRRVLIEIKPRIDSLSNSIAQVKSYCHFLKYTRCQDGIKSDKLPECLLITIDNNDTFDKLLEDQNICVYRIAPKELK
jgi:hypothetical protein